MNYEQVEGGGGDPGANRFIYTSEQKIGINRTKYMLRSYSGCSIF